MPIKKIDAGRLNSSQTLDNYVGQEGTIFYDEKTGEMRISDGVTPGGIPLQGGTSGGGTGPRGYTGSKGLVGYTGSTGQPGYFGSTGQTGYTGSAGQLGSVGYTGSIGQTGYVGSSGAGLTAASNAGLTITNTVIATVYNSQISDDVQSIAVGGAAAASAASWKSKNIVEVLDTILFPDVLPTYTVPTLSVSGNQSGIKEIGSTVVQALTLSAVKNDAGVFTAISLSRGATQLSAAANPTGTIASSIAAQFGYADANNPNYSYALSYSDTFVIINGSTSWSGSGTYSAGLSKQNNKGVADSRAAQIRSTAAPQSGSSITGNSVSVTGIYPYFWGKSSTPPTASSIAAAIAAGTANKVLADASGTVIVTFAAAAEYV